LSHHSLVELHLREFRSLQVLEITPVLL